MRFRSFLLAACVALALVGAVPSQAQVEGADWPLDFQAAYNETTQVLSLSWQPPEGVAAGDVDEYRVYRDGSQIGNPTTTGFDDDLSTWAQGLRSYEVSAVVDGVEGAKTLPIHVGKVKIPLPIHPGCTLFGIIIDTSPPGVYPRIHWECVPL